MSERTDIHTALGFVLRRMNELAAEVGNPDAPQDKIRREASNLRAKWRELMDRLVRSPLPGEQAERK